MSNIVRIESIKIHNFKGITNGEVSFNENTSLQNKRFDVTYSSLLGIYGQNGSGKTAIIEAIRIIQQSLSSNNLPNNIINFISTNEKTSNIEVCFLIESDKLYYVKYLIEFSNELNNLKIASEKLSYFDNLNKKTIHLYNYNKNQKEILSGYFFDKLDNKEQFALSLNLKMLMSDINQKSSIFNTTIIEMFRNNKKINQEHINILESLMDFGINRLAIYQINYFDNNEKMGIRMRVRGYLNNMPTSSSDMFISFNNSSIKKTYINDFYQLIDKINQIMNKIIPHYELQVSNQTETFAPDGSIYILFNLKVKKNDSLYDIIYESNGIKKIISILSGFIDAFNKKGSCIVIDEFDSGVFEYLFGELLSTFEQFGEGQLIFTSHNLRPLEKLSYKNIVFTTTSAENHFIRLKGIKETTNMRDKYYRYIYSGDEFGNIFYDLVKTETLIDSLYLNNQGDLVD